MEMEMAKTNGWAVTCSPSSSRNVHSKYTRCTELRHVSDPDVYKLAILLDSNSCWRKLMSIIPKHLDAQACSAPGALNLKEIVKKVGYKYTGQEIGLIENERLSSGQSLSEVMINEWKTSGKQHERPTVGVLLQLLIEAEIYSAADHVAEHFLNEPRPERPNDGPAKPLNLSSGDLDEDMEVDEGAAAFQPNLAAAQVRGTGMNLDVFDKERRDKSVPQPLENGATRVPQQALENGGTRPVPPPRGKSRSSAINTPNMPILSILNASEKLTSLEQIQQAQNIPNVSILNGSSSDNLSRAHTATSVTTTSRATLDAGITEVSSSNGSYSVDTTTTTTTTGTTAGITTPNVPLITLLIENSTGEINTTSNAADNRTKKSTAAAVPDANGISQNSLPAISALNLNNVSGDNGPVPHAGNIDNNSDTNSLDDDDEDEDEDDEEDYEDADVSLRNLSNSEHQISNNDSSLTTVTGTSGDNSFELTNDSSSTSNDDYSHNIPNLSELQQQL